MEKGLSRTLTLEKKVRRKPYFQTSRIVELICK